MDYETLRNHTAGRAAAYRLKTKLEPVGGPGDKIFPPTYLIEDRDSKYALERDAEGKLTSVLLDSVASQANRAELGLLDALESGDLRFPAPYIDFSECEEVNFERLSVLEAPHRIADAIFRDSELGGALFRTTEIGREILSSSPLNALGVYKYAPTSLLFGVWDSTGPRGAFGMKFQRAYVSEIVGRLPQTGVKTESRIDPLAIEASVKLTAPRKSDADMWELDPKGKGKPSEVNHSNVAPSVETEAGGVYIQSASQVSVLSLAALRKLRFKGYTQSAQISARTALAALGVVCLVQRMTADHDLRSRCLLVPAAPSEFKAIARDRSGDEDLHIDAATAAALLETAVERCESDGIGWNTDELALVPSQKLLGLIRESRSLTPSKQAD